MFRASEGAEDRTEEAHAAAASLGPGDLVIGISASSVTPFTRALIERGRENGARTVLLTCTSRVNLEALELLTLADLTIALDTGGEVLTGSTRLKAGSATKAALNAISTVAMVRQGKVLGNLMIDLRQGSAKLVDRARRILETVLELERDAAVELLEHADGEVKTAIVMGRLGLDAPAARARLETAKGHVRDALSSPRGDLRFSA